jgi:subtilisin family serine protease
MNSLRALSVTLLALAFVPVAVGGPADDAPERLVVLFDAMPPGLQEHGRYNGGDVLAVDETLGFAVVNASHGRAFREQAKGLREVRAVEADGIGHSLGLTPNDPMFPSPQYAPRLIGAPAAWSTTLGASSATLCLLDTGVRTTHQDLAAHYAGGTDLVNRDSDPADDGGHGTRTAGVAAAVINNGVGVSGVANVPFKEVKVLGASGSGYDSTVASGIRWCADNGARVVSISIGFTGASTAIRDAVDYAWGKGLILVAGAGNGGCDNCVLYPAAFPNVIAVGAVDSSATVQSFTSKGPQMDLAAPGVNIQTTGYGSDTSYLMGGGTSLSAPHVAGAVALVWSAHPTWTNTQVRTALEATAQDVGPAGFDDWSGHGMVRPDRAIAYGSTATTSTSSSTTSSTASTAFTASFAVASGSNEWWEEVKVTSSAAPAKVDFSANGGAWQAMALKSWGNWAANVYVQTGTPVAFRATDSAGHTAASAPQPWLGSATATSSPSTTSSTSTTTAPAFSATFTPKAVGNDWWVETAVSANQALAKVEAKVDSGSYVVLTKQDWGTYAKSINAPNGSLVTFRATSSTGATATSSAFTWT